ncbi:MAG: 50S ribosomal protein L4 [Clostridia bacterium]|nr:50S ribosomal protein L4 [Clostridia bacterium]MBQ3093463.1 50S ribosomal protein L4 [Clostridia bacterium]
MPKITVLDMQGKEVEVIDLPESIFGIEPNQDVMHDVVVNYLANRRQGTQSALTRAEVSGGGKKPWRQKGTGHARQGSIRAPQWRHGGIVFAPKPRDYSYVLNKKVKRLALKSAFSSKFLGNNIIVLDNIKLEEYKTKTMINILQNIKAEGKSLIVLPEVNNMIIKSSNNIPGVKTSQINNLNVYDILNAKNLVILKDSISKIEEVYA